MSVAGTFRLGISWGGEVTGAGAAFELRSI